MGMIEHRVFVVPHLSPLMPTPVCSMGVGLQYIIILLSYPSFLVKIHAVVCGYEITDNCLIILFVHGAMKKA